MNYIMQKSGWILLLVLTFSTSIFAAPFTVNTTNDTVDVNAGNGICADSAGNCSLRAAIGETNQLATVLATRINSITLPAGIYTLTLTGTRETSNASGDLNIRNSSNLTINGDNSRTTIIQAGTIKSTNGTDGNGIDRVLSVFNSGTVILTLNNLTIRNGKAVAVGFNNQGGGLQFGAGLSTGLVLNISNCAFVDNFAQEDGGGVFISSNTNSIIEKALIAGNTASLSNWGGGLFAAGSTNLINTTISGNVAGGSGQSGQGGGLYVADIVNITNCTVNGNTAIGNNSRAGGISVAISATARLRNTIVSGNTATLFGNDFSRLGSSVNATIISGGTNLISDSTTSTGWDATDLLNNTSANLGILTNNGGQTDSHSVPPGSSALNSGQNCVVDTTCVTFNAPSIVLTDQRGENRLVDGFARAFALIVDIGAYEKATPTAAAVSISGRVLTSDGRGLRNAVVSITDTNGQIRQTRTGSFGYYSFDDVEAGQTYIIAVNSKLYQFAPQIISVQDNLEDVNFTPVSNQFFMGNISGKEETK